MVKQFTFILVATLLLFSCSNKNSKNIEDKKPDTLTANSLLEVSNHSYSNIDEINTTDLFLDLAIDFNTKIISGVARHTMNNKGTTKAIFDINKLSIDKVTIGKKENERAAIFTIGEYDSILGAPLIVSLEKEDSIVNIYYSTSPDAIALGWLDSNLTQTGLPFLYTQGEAILTRSWIPIQDTPENRITYSANVKVPSNLLAVMSATNPTAKNKSGSYHFEMNQAIPSYLIALAVGDIVYQKIDDKCGVYAEPYMIEAAHNELKNMPEMIAAAEKLYGDYQWEQYDVLVLPSSFPYGGMENPRLTFVTPTIISGDRSLVTLVAHELAHSWSGNLVTMANWNDFWINEGFTMYIENRIMEEVFGKDIANMLALLNYQDLEETVQRLKDEGREEDTHLKLDLEGRNPDEGMSDIAYCKGFYFLKTLENTVGTKLFDNFLKEYFNSHKFESIITEDFVKYLNKELLEKNDITFNTKEWIYAGGIPDNAVKIKSKRFEAIKLLSKAIKNGESLPKELKRKDKVTQEWLTFIRSFNGKLSVEIMKQLDKQLDFKNANSEIKTEWFVLGIKNGYTALNPAIKTFLTHVGRMKFLEPLYIALAEQSEATKKWAIEVYEEARGNYHPLSYKMVDAILGYSPNS